MAKLETILETLDPEDLIIDSNGEAWRVTDIDASEDTGDYELRGNGWILRYDSEEWPTIVRIQDRAPFVLQKLRQMLPAHILQPRHHLGVPS